MPPSPKRRRTTAKKRLYLVFDDWPWGYTIRELDLSSSSTSSSRRQNLTAAGAAALPRPIIRLEAPRGNPSYFTAVGSRIVATHARNPFDDDSVAEGFLPIVDVRSRGVLFGPRNVSPFIPIYLAVGDDELFAIDNHSFHVLSLKPLWPPRLEIESSCDIVEWSWRELPKPPFRRSLDVTSYAVDSDGHTILAGTAAGTFAFDTAAAAPMWTRRGETMLPPPFTGRVYFVSELNAFVGLSTKDPAILGHLICSSPPPPAADTDDDGHPAAGWKLGKEKLFREGPGESHVSATLVYMGGTEFCLVQCVVGSAIVGDQEEEMEGDYCDQEDELEEEGGDCGQEQRGSSSRRYIYRVTTFSLGYDDSNGDLTTGDTCRTQCYKVPRGATEMSVTVDLETFNRDPVAFWL